MIRSLISRARAHRAAAAEWAGAALVIVGIAAIYWPVALIVAGLAIIALVNLDGTAPQSAE